MTAKETPSFWEKLGKIDYREIYAIMTILVALPLIYPLGVPQSIGDNVKAYANKLESLPDGSVVVCYFSGYATMLSDCESIYYATWKILLNKDVKLLIVMAHPDSPIVIRQEFEELGVGTTYDKVEGVDYVILPYIDISSDAATMSFTENIRSVFTEDINGVSLDELEMTKNITTAKDFTLVITLDPEFANRRYTIPYGTPLVAWGTATGLLPFVAPFYNSETGPIYGYVGGASQGAELESYTGYYGDGVKTNDAKNLGVIGLIAIVVIGNISMIGTKYGGKKK